MIGATARLVLTGSRGLATTLLWREAIEKQKRNEWTELEFLVRTLTKLQPHFLTPWLFQSWNLSYNVSVEADRVRDKYFYISRGIELLAQGERLNKDNPDMRYWIAFYYQNKFGVSDENNSLRSLFQLSCMPPDERTPRIYASEAEFGAPLMNRLLAKHRGEEKDEKKAEAKAKAEYEANMRDFRRDFRQFYFADGRIFDPVWFTKFCKQHPQLVRRLREPAKDLRRPFRCRTPLDVAEFLLDNRGLPTRFVEPDPNKGKLYETILGKVGDQKPPDQQFPILPTSKPVRYRPDDFEPTANDTAATLGDSFDPFTAARAWFAYAQDPLPDPDPLADAIDRKERIKSLKDRRLPRQPAEVLFRQSPCRAQSYVGERLHKEGWFDNSGWVVDAGRAGRERWFPRDLAASIVRFAPEAEKEPWFPRGETDIVVGAGADYATDAWEKAYGMWSDFGERNGMLFRSEPERISLEAQARKFQERFNVGPTDQAFVFRPETLDPEMQECLRAQRLLAIRETNLSMTNFMHHYVKAKAERLRETAQARKTIDLAQRFHLLAMPEQAIKEYEKGFTQWKAVLRDQPQFRDDEGNQEELLRIRGAISRRDSKAPRGVVPGGPGYPGVGDGGGGLGSRGRFAGGRCGRVGVPSGDRRTGTADAAGRPARRRVRSGQAVDLDAGDDNGPPAAQLGKPGPRAKIPASAAGKPKPKG